jgi:polysaccharide export outer membrane protein
MRMRRFLTLSLMVAWASTLTVAQALGQGGPRTPAASANGATADGVRLPAGYVIGSDDILSVVFWRDKDMSADVTVRPDGKISLPLLNEVTAAGLTPEQLRQKLTEAAGKLIEDPNITIVVKEIRSRNVFITGNVTKPAMYPLIGQMTVLQLIAVAGGLQEYADSKNIKVIRTENGRQEYHTFNYKDVVSEKHTAQNIALKPGDTVYVP